MAWFVPSYSGEAPTWVYVLNFATTLIYMHLDCLDGKQARRTGSSTPLGQLFDHGCDALTLHFLVSSPAAAATLSQAPLGETP